MGTGHENPHLKIGDWDNFQNGSNSHLFQRGKVSMSAKFHAFITICTIHTKICFCLLHYLKHLNLYVIIKMILILELMFCCILANKAAESYEFIADQTSLTSSKELVEPSEIFGVENCWRRETYSDISDISELSNWPRKLLYYKILVIPSCQTLAMIFSHCWQ